MNNSGIVCPRWASQVPNGITNGADWYPVAGGMQDFNYLYAGTMELTMEISCCKYSHKWRLLQEWENNKESLLNFIEQVNTGIKGFVTEQSGSKPSSIDGNHIEVRVRKAGSGKWRKIWSKTEPTELGNAYWKILNDGEYEVQAVEWNLDSDRSSADFRKIVRQSDVMKVQIQNDLNRGAQRLDLKLPPFPPINPRAVPELQPVASK